MGEGNFHAGENRSTRKGEVAKLRQGTNLSYLRKPTNKMTNAPVTIFPLTMPKVRLPRPATTGASRPSHPLHLLQKDFANTKFVV
jgi:hypothetical protein